MSSHENSSYRHYTPVQSVKRTESERCPILVGEVPCGGILQYDVVEYGRVVSSCPKCQQRKAHEAMRRRHPSFAALEDRVAPRERFPEAIRETQSRLSHVWQPLWKPCPECGEPVRRLRSQWCRPCASRLSKLAVNQSKRDHNAAHPRLCVQCNAAPVAGPLARLCVSCRHINRNAARRRHRDSMRGHAA